jgi:hypothetical protein
MLSDAAGGLFHHPKEKTMQVTFTNNSVSGRDYRAKGFHVEIPGNSTVTKNVPDGIVDKVVAALKRTSPAIQVIVHDVEPASVPAQDVAGSEEAAEEEAANPVEDTETPESPPEPAKKRRGRGRRKAKRQPKAQDEPSESAEVTVQEVIEG